MSNVPDTRLDDLLIAWDHARDCEGEPSLTDLCRDAPELLGPLAERIAAIRRIERLVEPDIESLAARSMSDTSRANDDTAPTWPRLAPLPPTVGTYRVLALLGSGGMGHVYLAEDPKLRRQVAIKMIRPELAARPLARERFQREARAMAAVEHDHVVPVYGVDEQDGVPFLVMPALRGQTLATRLRGGGRLELRETCRIARQIAQGLAAAHERGLIHRDIKPGNIWLEGADAKVKILDFGLARMWNSEGVPQLTRHGDALGTPTHMAPEQASGGQVDARSDLFSLGCILYEMLAGRPPFAGGSLIEVLYNLANHRPQPLAEIDPNLPRALTDLIERLLMKAPDGRPSSAQQVVDELVLIEHDLADRTAAREAQATPVSNNRTAISASHGRDRRSAAYFAVGVVIAAALLAAGWSVWQVITVKTDYGTLIVQTEDDSVEVRVKRDGVVLVDATSRREIELKAGEYELELADNATGLRLSTTRFKIVRNGRETVRVFYEPEQRRTPGAAAQPVESVLTASGFDHLDAAQIPDSERFHWQPQELVAVVGRHARRHWGFGAAAAISPDGALAATLSASGAEGLIVWDFATQTPKWKFTRYHDHHGSLQFSADGRRLFCVANGHFSIYDLTVEPIRERRAPLLDEAGKPMGQIVFGRVCESERTLVAWGHDERVLLFDLSGEQPRATAELRVAAPGRYPLVAEHVDALIYNDAHGTWHRGRIRDSRFVGEGPLEYEGLNGESLVAISGDGSRLAASGPKGLRILDLTGLRTMVHAVAPPGFRGGVIGLSAKGQQLIASDGLTTQYRIASGTLEKVGDLDLTSNGPAVFATTSDGTRTVVLNFFGLARFWEISDQGAQERSPPDFADAFFPPTYANRNSLDRSAPRLMVSRFDEWPNGQLIDLGGTSPRPWPNSKELLRTDVAGPLFPITGTRWLQAPYENRPRLYGWHENAWRPISDPFGEPLLAGAVSPDGNLFVSVVAGRMECWDVSGELRHKWSIPLGEHRPALLPHGGVYFSGDSRRFAIPLRSPPSGPWHLSVWRNEGDKPEQVASIPIMSKDEYAYCVAWSGDGRLLAHLKESGFGEVVVENLGGPTPREIARLELQHQDVHCIAFHPRERSLAVGSSTGVTIFDLASQSVAWRWDAPGSIPWLAFSPDGRHLLSHNRNGTIYVLRFDSSPASRDSTLAP